MEDNINIDDNCKLVINVINKKIKNMSNENAKYHFYSSNQLFVYAHYLYFPALLKGVIDEYNKDAIPNFDKIYFFTNPHLLIYTPKTNTKEELIIDGNILERIQNEALAISAPDKSKNVRMPSNRGKKS